ncbi:unnamed protein product [Amoebophrya sp. A25]|nr:unnamed protein product [Amoebophrya sp. A25]|eukprot:GSA25T00021484001.1
MSLYLRVKLISFNFVAERTKILQRPFSNHMSVLLGIEFTGEPTRRMSPLRSVFLLSSYFLRSKLSWVTFIVFSEKLTEAPNSMLFTIGVARTRGNEANEYDGHGAYIKTSCLLCAWCGLKSKLVGFEEHEDSLSISRMNLAARWLPPTHGSFCRDWQAALFTN